MAPGISSLPDDLLVRILSHVRPRSHLTQKISLVSRRFRDLCLDPSFWRSLKLTKEDDVVAAAAVRHLMWCRAYLRELEIPRWRGGVKELLFDCGNKLHRLKMVVASVEDLHVVTTMDGLESLEIELLLLAGEERDRFPPTEMQQLVAFFPHMTKLVLTRTKGICRVWWKRNVLEEQQLILQLSDGVKRARVQRAATLCTLLHDEVVFPLLLASKNTLLELQIDVSAMLTEAKSLGALMKCKLLQKLTLGDATCMDGAMFKSILESLPMLLHLKLRWCHDLTAEDFTQALAAAASRNRLQSLTLEYSHRNLNDSALMILAEHYSELTLLDLHSMGERITDAGLSQVLIKCTNLRHLRLACDPRTLTDEAFEKAVLEKKSPLQLQTLTTCCCLLAKHLEKIAKLIPQLEIIDQCEEFTRDPSSSGYHDLV